MSFYCYEYKTAAAGFDSTQALLEFEQQWAYFLGFGITFASVQFYLKWLGSAVFFVAFPFYVIIAMDPVGQGCVPKAQKKRISQTHLPIFTVCLRIKQLLLGNK
jgi:hypothetical protein